MATKLNQPSTLTYGKCPWRSTKAKHVMKAFLKLGWIITRQTGSHKIIQHPNGKTFSFAFHDNEEIGPPMLNKIAKYTDLRPQDL